VTIEISDESKQISSLVESTFLTQGKLQNLSLKKQHISWKMRVLKVLASTSAFDQRYSTESSSESISQILFACNPIVR